MLAGLLAYSGPGGSGRSAIDLLWIAIDLDFIVHARDPFAKCRSKEFDHNV